MGVRASEVQILTSGGIGVMPTDTIYGLVGRALSRATVERIYMVKGRTPTKPLIILISSLSDMKKFGVRVDAKAKKICAALWPGPVSIIFPCKKNSLRYLHRGTNTLAFRLPKKPSLRALIKQTGPLVAPSANPEGREPAASTREAHIYFKDAVDFYRAGTVSPARKPSTLVRYHNGKLMLLRDGAKKIPMRFL